MKKSGYPKILISFFVSISVGQIWEAFSQLSGEDFKSKYGFDRPEKSAKIGLLCKLGKRATDASDKLLLMGYENVLVYKGSFMDWQAKGGQIIKPE